MSAPTPSEKERVGRASPRESGVLWTALLSAAIVGGAGCASGRTPDTNQPGVPDERNHAQVGEMETPSSSLAGDLLPLSAASVGYGGLVIHAASHVYMATQGRVPNDVGDLRPYIPFANALQGFQLRVAEHPDGRRWLLAEREVAPADSPGSLLVGQEVTPRGAEGFVPAVGVHASTERYLVADLALANENGLCSSESWAYRQFGSGPLEVSLAAMESLGDVTGYPSQINSREPVIRTQVDASGQVETGRDFNAGSSSGRSATGIEDPEATSEMIHVGYIFHMVNAAAYTATMNASDFMPPESLSELEAMFGPLNTDAWINPYTNEPMQQVQDSSPGDYTVHDSPMGVMIEFHFLDPEGVARSITAGFDGPHDPSALLRMWSGEDIGLREVDG